MTYDPAFYPKPPAAGSNGFGTLSVGFSQVGSIPPFRWRDTVMSQYANSPILLQVIESFFVCIDQTRNLDLFFDLIFNIDTAVGYGLDVWGRIVGVPRNLVVMKTGSYFGFEQSEPFTIGFGGAPFYLGQAAPTSTTTYILDDDTYRRVILAKAAFNITDGSIPSINALLLALFRHRGNCWVSDAPVLSPYFGFEQSANARGFGGAPFYMGQTIPHMSIQYVFTFPLTDVDLAIITQSGVIPTPAGVAYSIVQTF
jgi:hypothetical protein